MKLQHFSCKTVRRLKCKYECLIDKTSIYIINDPKFGVGPFSSDFVIFSTTLIAGPNIRITEMPALPGADASANMVSNSSLVRVWVFIESKKSEFVLVCFNFDNKNSMPSVKIHRIQYSSSTKVLVNLTCLQVGLLSRL